MSDAFKALIIISFIGAIVYYFVFMRTHKSNEDIEEIEKDNKQNNKTPNKIGRELEFKTLNHYVSNGYNVIDCAKDLPKADLMGVDLIAEKGNQILLIQCKNYLSLNNEDVDKDKYTCCIYKALYKLANYYDLHYKDNLSNKVVLGKVILPKEIGKLPSNIYNIFASRQDGSAYRKEFPIRYEMI